MTSFSVFSLYPVSTTLQPSATKATTLKTNEEQDKTTTDEMETNTIEISESPFTMKIELPG